MNLSSMETIPWKNQEISNLVITTIWTTFKIMSLLILKWTIWLKKVAYFPTEGKIAEWLIMATVETHELLSTNLY